MLTPALTIVKTASTATAGPGQQVTYTLTVTDTGQTPYTGASVTDPLAGVLDDAAYNNDAAATAGTVSYASPALAWTGDLTPGGSAAITYSVTIDNPDTGDHSWPTPSPPRPRAATARPGGTDPRCTATVTVVSAATLTITQAAGAPSTVAGGVVHYTITIANSGLSPYAGASVTDPLSGVLDDAAYDSDAAAVITGTGTAAGTVTFASPDLTWAGTVPAAGSVTLTYSVTVHNPDTGDQILSSTVTSASAGSNCPAGTADPRCAVTVTVAQLLIDFTASTATTTPGGWWGIPRRWPTRGRPRTSGSVSALIPPGSPMTPPATAMSMRLRARCRSGRPGRCGPGTSRSGPRSPSPPPRPSTTPTPAITS